MSYIYNRFGTLTLPAGDPTMDIGTGEAQSAPFPLVSGSVFDGFTNTQARQKPLTLTYTGTISGDIQGEVDDQYEDLQTWIGKRDLLYRRNAYGVEQWMTCRLINIAASKSIDDGIFSQRVTLTFLSLEYPWRGAITYGAGWTYLKGSVIVGGLVYQGLIYINMPAAGSLTLLNAGNYPVRTVGINVHANVQDVTQFTIKKTGQADLKFAGPQIPAAGKSVWIDCGGYNILNDGVDAFGIMSRQAGHVIPEWLCLDPGSNTIDVTKTQAGGGTVTIAFVYDSGWA